MDLQADTLYSLDIEEYLEDLIEEGDRSEEVVDIQAICEEGRGYFPDWQHGCYLYSEHYFEEYARDLAEEVSGTDLTQWPATCIDWEQAASDLQGDYTSIEVEGTTYYGV